MSPSVDVIWSGVIAPLNDDDIRICEFNMHGTGSIGDLLRELRCIGALYGLPMAVINAFDLHSNANALLLGRTAVADHC